MALVGERFDRTFTFARPIAAGHLDAAGQPVEAAPDAPRFDHDETGGRRGLLVEGGPYLGAADRIAVVAGDWETAGPATVLHEHESPGGIVTRRAVYTAAPRATVNALLRAAGHHRRIGAVQGHLRNLGGHVRYRRELWALPGAIADADGAVLSQGDDPDRPLIEG